MFSKTRLACSFCGKDETKVEKLIAGPKVYICDKCVLIADQIMNGEAPVIPSETVRFDNPPPR